MFGVTVRWQVKKVWWGINLYIDPLTLAQSNGEARTFAERYPDAFKIGKQKTMEYHMVRALRMMLQPRSCFLHYLLQQSFALVLVAGLPCLLAND